jgi:hypothetical protein
MNAAKIDGNERLRRGLAGGAAAGAVAGLVLAAFLTVMNLTHGKDLWVALKGAALPFLGARAAQPGFDALAVCLGVVCHFAVSIGWGILFGVIVYGLSRNLTPVAGAVWGIVVWLGMYYVVLPAVGAGEVTRATPVSNAIVTHLLFGISLALGFLPYQRTVEHPTGFPTEHGAPLPH